MTEQAISIYKARTDQDISVVRDLIARYAKWLEKEHGISLGFQGIEEELSQLPGKYSAPGGEILLAKGENEEILGMIALRPYQNDTCEIKRLFVLPQARGKSLGKRLVSEILDVARQSGYIRAILDTGPFMTSALRLYESVGFKDIPAYYHNPFPGARYMALDLD